MDSLVLLNVIEYKSRDGKMKGLHSQLSHCFSLWMWTDPHLQPLACTASLKERQVPQYPVRRLQRQCRCK